MFLITLQALFSASPPPPFVHDPYASTYDYIENTEPQVANTTTQPQQHIRKRKKRKPRICWEYQHEPEVCLDYLNGCCHHKRKRCGHHHPVTCVRSASQMPCDGSCGLYHLGVGPSHPTLCPQCLLGIHTVCERMQGIDPGYLKGLNFSQQQLVELHSELRNV